MCDQGYVQLLQYPNTTIGNNAHQLDASYRGLDWNNGAARRLQKLQQKFAGFSCFVKAVSELRSSR